MNAGFFETEVTGKKIVDVERRAKYLLFRLDSGKLLLIHLMLGGWIYFGDEQDKPDNTAQVVLSFGAERLYFLGLRLGYVHLLTAPEAEKKLNKLGPEPLDETFDEQIFLDAISSRRSVVKTMLVDQEVVSGIGNRYSDEICFAAGIRPTRKINELQNDEKANLHRAIPEVLSEAVRLGGYTSRPFFKKDRLTGGFLPYFKVYNDEGKTCERCGYSVIRDEISSRKTFYCPNCQY